MPYRLKGILKLPNSAQVAAGVDIEFISRRNYSPLLMDLSSIIKTSPTGAYDITLEYGEYAVVLYWGCNQPSHIGKLFVFADTVEGLDLQTLLQQADWQPATPDYIQQIQEWLATASSAAASAIESSAKAKASELLIEEDRAEVESNKTIVENAQTDVTEKCNDVTQKAAQVATNTATVNEKAALAIAAADTASQKAVETSENAAKANDAAIRAENAATAMIGAVLDGGQCNLSSGFYPPPVVVSGKKYSTVWYVQAGGVVSGTSFDAGDVLRYTAATNSYFKVDAVDTTTAQINAHKVDPNAHAINTIIGLQDALNDKYSPSNKPSATDVGAIPSVGGNATGPITYSINGVALTNVHDRSKAGAYWRNVHAQTRLGILPGKLTRFDEVAGREYSVFDEGNKPSAGDVGADPAGTAASSTLAHEQKAGAHPISGVDGLQLIIDAIASSMGAPNLVVNPDLNNPVSQRAFNGNWSSLAIGAYGYDQWIKVSDTHMGFVIEDGKYIANKMHTLTVNNVVVKQVMSPASGHFVVAIPFATSGIYDFYAGEFKRPWHPPEDAIHSCRRYYREGEASSLLSNPSGGFTSGSANFYVPFSPRMRVPPAVVRTGTGPAADQSDGTIVIDWATTADGFYWSKPGGAVNIRAVGGIYTADASVPWSELSSKVIIAK